MKNILLKSIVMSVLGLTMSTASAVGTLVYSNPGARLSCITPDTCGTYVADHPVEVRRSGTEMRLTWNLNAPAGIDDGYYKAHTVVACPLGSQVSNMTAVWELNSFGAPTSVSTTHCDGETVSQFRIILRPVIDINECFYDPSLCIEDF